MKPVDSKVASKRAKLKTIRWPVATIAISWVVLQCGPALSSATPTSSSSLPHRAGIAQKDHAVHHHRPSSRDRSQEAQAPHHQPAIPRILHNVYLSKDPTNPGPVAPVNLSTTHAGWRQVCQEIHPDWELRFWDDEAAEDLVKKRYKSFWPAWEAYDRAIMRSDAIRPLILHAFGGLYLDLDMECFKRVDPLLEGYSLVFQMELNTGPEHAPKLNNGAMASAPGHPFWEHFLRVMAERAPIKNQGPWGLKDLKEEDWQLNVYWKTGPTCLADAFADWLKEKHSPSHEKGPVSQSHIDSSWWEKFHVYRVGEFFFPCNWDNPEYCKEVEAMAVKPEKTAGMHHFSGTWLEKPFKL